LSESSDSQRCELCQVVIESSTGRPDLVQFSNGPQGSRSKLWSRVCQYVTDPDRQRICINQDSEGRGAEQAGDAFPDAPPIDLGNT
jgi:hypothetical protein